MHEKLQQIKDESLRDGKGVILHIDDIKWIYNYIEKLELEIGQLKNEVK